MTKTIYIATSNQHKADEAKDIFSKYDIEVEWKKISVDEPDYETLEEIAQHKARFAYEKLKVPVIVEDTGIFFSAYNGFPGQYAKRMFLSLGFEGLLKLLEDKKRNAHFKTVACYYDGKNFLTKTGELHGEILKKIRGKNAKVLPYEKIFKPEGQIKPLSKIPREEKNKFSHRYLAFKGLAEKISELKD